MEPGGALVKALSSGLTAIAPPLSMTSNLIKRRAIA